MGGNESPSITIPEIRSRIERTRSEMSETIVAIEDRLRPRRLVGEAGHSIKARMERTVAHPAFPLTLLGMAATALVARSVKQRRRRRRAI
jgi:hypothetical protein